MSSMKSVSSASSSCSNSASVQRRSSCSLVASTRSRGTSRPSPWRCFGSTTRWVTLRATGSTTTRSTSPQIPSLQLTSTPIVNFVPAMATFPVPFDPTIPHLDRASGSRRLGLSGRLRQDEQMSGKWVPPTLRGYQPSWLLADVLAGLTLVAIALPSQMATARLANLPAVVGLYAFIAGSLLYALIGTNRHLSVGADSTI